MVIINSGCRIGHVCRQASETKRDCPHWSPVPHCENCLARRICNPQDGISICSNYTPDGPKTKMTDRDVLLLHDAACMNVAPNY